MPKTIAILGGGIAGLTAAREAAYRFPDATIKLVNETPYLIYKPLLTYVATGYRGASEAYIPLSEKIVSPNVELVIGKVSRLDPNERLLQVDGYGEIRYDYLIVGTGAVPDDEAIPGLAKANSNPWTLEGATNVARALKAGARRVVVGSFQPPYPCPPAPIELAGLISKSPLYSGESSDVTLGFPGPKPLPPLGEEVSTKLETLITEAGLNYIRNFKPIEVDPDSKTLIHEAGKLEYEVLAIVPPFKPSSILAESGLAKDGSWPTVLLDKGFRHAEFDDVYVIGDASIAQFGPPMAGFLASYMAKKAIAEIGGLEFNKRAYAKCFVDYIEDGAAIFCDFTEVFTGGKPHCHVIAEGGLAGKYKRALEEYWRAFKV